MIHMPTPQLFTVKALTAEAPRPVNPYRRLSAFTEEDQSVFFGRDDELAQLVDYICNLDVVALLGESGIGKTSLLRAGLTPTLIEQGYEVTYIDCFRTPALALPWIQGASRSVLLLDRAEAMFTANRDAQCKQAMLDLIGRMANPSSSVKLVVSLRQDFAARLLDLFTEIRSLGGHSQILYLGPLGQEAAYRALVRPSETGAYPLAQDIAKVCLDDLDTSGVFYPMDVQVLGFELFEWAARHGRPMTLADYHATGGAQVLIDHFFAALVDN